MTVNCEQVEQMAIELAKAVNTNVNQTIEEIKQLLAAFRHEATTKKREEFFRAMSDASELIANLATLKLAAEELTDVIALAGEMNTDEWANAAEQAIERIQAQGVSLVELPPVLDDTGAFEIDVTKLVKPPEMIDPEELGLVPLDDAHPQA